MFAGNVAIVALAFYVAEVYYGNDELTDYSSTSYVNSSYMYRWLLWMFVILTKTVNQFVKRLSS